MTSDIYPEPYGICNVFPTFTEFCAVPIDHCDRFTVFEYGIAWRKIVVAHDFAVGGEVGGMIV